MLELELHVQIYMKVKPFILYPQISVGLSGSLKTQD